MLMSIMGFVAYASLALMVVIIVYSALTVSSELDDIEDAKIREAYERRIARDVEIFREVIDNE